MTSERRTIADLRLVGTTGDDQGDVPASIARWIADFDAIPPLEMTPEEEAEWNAARCGGVRRRRCSRGCQGTSPRSRSIFEAIPSRFRVMRPLVHRVAERRARERRSIRCHLERGGSSGRA
jgi:hypothetical protein